MPIANSKAGINLKCKYIEIRGKRKAQLDFIYNTLASYRVYDEETAQRLAKEIKTLFRLNDQHSLLEELLNDK